MNFPQFFISRPIFAAVLSILIMIVGGLAYYSLPVAQYPDIVPPTIQVTATYPGASPDIVADTVATPLEQELNGVDDMLYMTSQSTNNGAVTITITFETGTDIEEAQVLVQNRVARAEPRLPAEVRQTGIVTQKAMSDLLMVANLISPDSSLDQLFIGNYAFIHLRDALLRVDGVGSVMVFGANEYGLRIWLNPQKMRSLDLTVGDVIGALSQQNVQVAAGTIGQQPLETARDFEINVRAQGRLRTPEEFGEIVIKTGTNGSITRLHNVARVELGSQNYGVNSFLDGQPSIGIGITQSPGSNAVETAERVIEAFSEMSKDFPEGMAHRIVYNPTVFVEESITSVMHTLFEAVLLVVLVILLFLQSWRATIIPLVAIPVSLIGTFAVMAALGFSLNSLTLFGLVLAIGIVVDDAIVVVEGVERHLAEGLSPIEATRTAMREVSSALVSIALVLSAVFIPTAFITGISGQFYRQFAITIAAATLFSAFVSLTLSPALCAILLKHEHAKKDWFQRVWDFLFGWLFKAFNTTFDRFTKGYTFLVTRFIRLAILMLVVYGGLIGLAGLGFKNVPSGFIPDQDQGYLITAIQMPDGASLTRTGEIVKKVAEIARSVDGIAHTIELSGFSGATRTNAANAGAVFVPLDDFHERDDRGLTSDMIADELQQKLAAVDEALVIVIKPPPVTGIGTGGGWKLMLQNQSGADYVELENTANQLLAAAREEPGLVQPYTTFRASTPQFYADIDRTKAQKLDVPLSEIFQSLQVFLGSAYVNDFNQFGRTYRVTAQADSEFRDDADDIYQFAARSRSDAIVPLGSLVKMQRVTGPDRVVRHNLYPSAEVSGLTAPGYSSGDSLATMERLAKDLPPGYAIEWVDLSYQESVTGNTAIIVFSLAVVFVFLLLSAQYESWSLPMAVILIVPMCLLGAIAGVWIRGMENNILTQIGFVVLIGLAAKNAILIVEFASQQEKEGKSIFDSAVEAARLRLRPILMTSFAFILGVVPLVIASGPGSEMRQALGTAVFAGMIGVTFFGIIFTPVFYYVVRSLFARKTNRTEADAPA